MGRMHPSGVSGGLILCLAPVLCKEMEQLGLDAASTTNSAMEDKAQVEQELERLSGLVLAFQQRIAKVGHVHTCVPVSGLTQLDTATSCVCLLCSSCQGSCRSVCVGTSRSASSLAPGPLLLGVDYRDSLPLPGLCAWENTSNVIYCQWSRP